MNQVIQPLNYYLQIFESWKYLETNDLYNGKCSENNCYRPAISRKGEVKILCSSHFQELRSGRMNDSRFIIGITEKEITSLHKLCRVMVENNKFTHCQKVIKALTNAHVYGIPGLTSMEIHQVLGMSIEKVRKRTSDLKLVEDIIVVGYREDKCDEVLAVRKSIPRRYFGIVETSATMMDHTKSICPSCNRPEFREKDRKEIIDVFGRVADSLRSDISPNNNDIRAMLRFANPLLKKINIDHTNSK